jgi:hypothetical protein
MQAVAKLIVPDWEDKVDSGRVVIPPARLHRMGAATTTYAGFNSFSQSAAMNLATGSLLSEYELGRSRCCKNLKRYSWNFLQKLVQ